MIDNQLFPDPALPTTLPEGLIYVPDFVSVAEQVKLLSAIDEREWSQELKRRVQHYGYRYDYKV